MEKHKIIVEHIPNSHKRVFHTSLRININTQHGKITVSQTHNWEGVIGHEITTELTNRDRINTVTIEPHKLEVEIKDDLDWGCVEPYIITLLKRVFMKHHKVPPTQIQVSEKYSW